MSDEEFERLLLDEELSHDDILGFVGTMRATLAAERAAHAVAVEAAYMEGFNDGEQDDGSDTPTKRADLAWGASGARTALRAGEPKP